MIWSAVVTAAAFYLIKFTIGLRPSEDVEREGWMAWLEQGDEAYLNTCFQSDGTRMLWEVTQPQPDHVLMRTSTSV